MNVHVILVILAEITRKFESENVHIILSKLEINSRWKTTIQQPQAEVTVSVI